MSYSDWGNYQYLYLLGTILAHIEEYIFKSISVRMSIDLLRYRFFITNYRLFLYSVNRN